MASEPHLLIKYQPECNRYHFTRRSHVRSSRPQFTDELANCHLVRVYPGAYRIVATGSIIFLGEQSPTISSQYASEIQKWFELYKDSLDFDGEIELPPLEPIFK